MGFVFCIVFIGWVIRPVSRVLDPNIITIGLWLHFVSNAAGL